MRVSVRAVEPGAAYEGVVYDQYLVVDVPEQPAAGVLSLFDMAPMIAEGVSAGQALDVLVAVAAPAQLTWDPDPEIHRTRGANHGMVRALGIGGAERAWRGHRGELDRRSWALLASPLGDVLLSLDELVVGLTRPLAVGDRLSWEMARLDLMAWAPAD